MTRPTRLIRDLPAIILAGGKGTRLREVVNDRPKPLAQVCGKPFLSWVIESLRQFQIRRFVLSTGFMADYFEQELGDGADLDAEICYVAETIPLGTGGGLRNAFAHIDDELVLVLNGDSWCDFDAAVFLRSHHESPAEASILLTHVRATDRYGGVTLENGNRIAAFQEKGCKPGPGWINAGIYLLSRSFIESIPGNVNVSLERDVFPAWVSNGIHGFKTAGSFIDIGTPESYKQAQELFGRRSGAIHQSTMETNS